MIKTLRRLSAEDLSCEYPVTYDIVRDLLLNMMLELYDRGLVNATDFWFVRASSKLNQMATAIQSALKPSLVTHSTVNVKPFTVKAVDTNSVDMADYTTIEAVAKPFMITNVKQEEVDV